ncbi:MAG: CoA pyrophosphatase [Luminiphilus sp.]|nr:CoA pyrophosphatase [Luminiphilus sp.]
MVFNQLMPRLQGYEKPDRAYGEVTRRAAVAIVLHEVDGELCLLMIRRAQREGDPWSGHMAFPGGRRDPDDIDDRFCAIRETREEIALDLDALGSEVCALGEVNTGWRADRPEMLVAPFIYRVEQLPELELNYEVDAVVSVPLRFLMDRSNRVPLAWEWRGTQVESDSYLYRDNRIWVLSLMMIDELIEAAER